MTAGDWANVILAVHFVYAAGVVLPLPLILLGWSRGWAPAHSNWFRTLNLLLVIPVLLEVVMRSSCPLTLLGNRFRAAAGLKAYGEGCVNHFLSHVLGRPMPPWLVSFLTSLLALWIALLYWRWPPPWLAARRNRAPAELKPWT